MARKTKTVRLTDQELVALEAYRQTAKASDPTEIAKVDKASITDSQQALADAFVSAIERTRAPEKKTVANRKPNTPWHPADGPARLKLKRKMYQHGTIISDRLTNEDIELLNKIRPGVYCDGNVRVTLRKDRGIDISYPVATASQRLRLVNQYGITSFTNLLQRLIAERADPAKYRKVEDQDLYDLE